MPCSEGTARLAASSNLRHHERSAGFTYSLDKPLPEGADNPPPSSFLRPGTRKATKSLGYSTRPSWALFQIGRALCFFSSGSYAIYAPASNQWVLFTKRCRQRCRLYTHPHLGRTVRGDYRSEDCVEININRRSPPTRLASATGHYHIINISKSFTLFAVEIYGHFH